MKEKHKFPPAPPTKELLQRIAKDFVRATSRTKFEESGCAVCGRLNAMTNLLNLKEANCNFNILKRDGAGVTQMERKLESDPITEINGPVMDNSCHSICLDCHSELIKGRTPLMALANDFWIGNVPKELQGLTYAERLLIARVRHNRCVVRVKGGMHKMRANAVTFANPMPKIYHILPPPVDELDEVLAFIYTGPCQPTAEDFKRTPLLVRRNKVGKALEWLKLNHIGY